MCDGFGMTLLAGGFQAGPWFQNIVALGAFGMLAPRFDWIPSWFPSQAPTEPRVEDTSSSSSYEDEDLDQLAQELDSLIEQSPIIEESSSEDTASDE